MDSGLYAAYTGVLARTQALDTAANNLANSNTNGFRAQRDYFRGVMAGLSADSGEGTLDTAVNSFGVLGGTSLDLSEGALQSTGNPLDLGLEGRGFFQVQTPRGIQLTRDGAFHRANDGTLTNAHGYAVLGDAGRPLLLPTGAAHVSADGTVSVDTAAGPAIAGRIALVDYAAADLVAQGTNSFIAHAGTAGSPSRATIREGTLEGANQDAVHGTVQLVLLQRQAEMMQKALSVFSNTLDKTAAEDLGRV